MRVEWWSHLEVVVDTQAPLAVIEFVGTVGTLKHLHIPSHLLALLQAPSHRVKLLLPNIYIYRQQGKVMFLQASVNHSVHNRPHGYSVTVHPCYGAVGMHPTGMLSCL